MSKENNETNNEFFADWYDLWAKQSKEFFANTEDKLQEMFAKNTSNNPDEYLKQMHEWLETFKKQWEFSQLTDEQKTYRAYWMMMSKLYNEASSLMIEQWTRRIQEQNPIKSVRELYDLWLKSCQEVYQKAFSTNSYQDIGEMMNSAVKFWQSTLSKK